MVHFMIINQMRFFVKGFEQALYFFAFFLHFIQKAATKVDMKRAAACIYFMTL